MNRLDFVSALVFALALAGCTPSPQPALKAIIGATLIDGTGARPVPDAVILTKGSSFADVGPRAVVPIPAAAERVNGAGKYVVPGLIDLEGSPAVNDYLAYGVTYARGALGGPMPHASTLAETRSLVDSGAGAILGMIGDTEEIDPSFLQILRDRTVVFAPQLARLEGSPELLSRAQRNTKRLADAGVPIGVASVAGPGVGVHREIELLNEAGLGLMQVIVAATRNGALALRKTEELGTITVGKRADLLLLSADPLADVGNLRKIERVMVNGEWAPAR